MSRKLFYEHVDVFTKKPFGGNQLAVFPSPGKLAKTQMQLIASEMNFSETTYIFPSKAEGADAKVRIFTPNSEIPFAGHPTLGTAFVMVTRKKGRGKKPEKVVLELGVGKIEVDIAYSGRKVDRLTMHQPVPRFGSALQNRGQAARALGIKRFDVIGGGVVSNGLDFLIVEAQGSEAVKKARLNMEEAVGVINRHKVIGIYLFARTEGKKANIHSRFFAPIVGVSEDPATGSAAGALGGYLARILKFPPELQLVIAQGIEMGRPSRIDVETRCERGMVHSVVVSGQAVRVGEGTIVLS
ncbi:MAG: PhzF family phenazine biosynthesis protein [Candidatus Krumholzibacteria bacterium]|nr:PhzF family phenazine biosynthesis protein [Candidatus Krumholzibacteria bacterium]